MLDIIRNKIKMGSFPPLPSAPTWQRGDGKRQRGEREGLGSPLCRLPPHGKGGMADGKEGRERGQIPPFAVCLPPFAVYLPPFAMWGHTAKRGTSPFFIYFLLYPAFLTIIRIYIYIFDINKKISVLITILK